MSGSVDGTVTVWDTDTGRALGALVGHDDEITALAITPGGHTVVSASADTTLRVWDVDNLLEARRLEGHRVLVMSVALTGSGRRVVSGSLDGVVRLWDLVDDGPAVELAGHTGSVVAVAAGGDRVVSASADNTLRVWDEQDGAPDAVLATDGATPWSLAVSRDGRRAVSGHLDATVRAWDLDTGAVTVLAGHTDRVVDVAISADGTPRGVGVPRRDRARLWDLRRGAARAVLAGHRGKVRAVALTAGGNRAASAADDATVRVWDLDRGAPIAGLSGDGGPLTSCALSGDGRIVVTGSRGGTVDILELVGAEILEPVGTEPDAPPVPPPGAPARPVAASTAPGGPPAPDDDQSASSSDPDSYVRKFLAIAQPGQANVLRFLTDEGVVTGFVIREDAEHIAALPAQPLIGMRSALLVEDGVGVVVVVFRIEGEVYETWLNHHGGEWLSHCLDDLAQQERLLFQFFTDAPEPARVVWIPNDPGEFGRILAAASGMAPWSMAEFDAAKARVCERHPSVHALWDALTDAREPVARGVTRRRLQVTALGRIVVDLVGRRRDARLREHVLRGRGAVHERLEHRAVGLDRGDHRLEAQLEVRVVEAPSGDRQRDRELELPRPGVQHPPPEDEVVVQGTDHEQERAEAVGRCGRGRRSRDLSSPEDQHVPLDDGIDRQDVAPATGQRPTREHQPFLLAELGDHLMVREPGSLEVVGDQPHRHALLEH